MTTKTQGHNYNGDAGGTGVYINDNGVHIVSQSFLFKENGGDQEHQKKTTKVKIPSLKRKGIKNTNSLLTPPSFLYWLALG